MANTTRRVKRRPPPTRATARPAAQAQRRSGLDWAAPWLSPPPRAVAMAGWTLLPLRVFLGFTFCFAGLQKLANPAFFDLHNPVSIQSQLAGAARRSPIHALVTPLTHLAVPLGIVIALVELAIGVGALLGLWTRVAAAGGAVLSLFLFLTVSFHSSPYYTGSDIVFLFAWLPLVLAGAGGVLSADAVISQRVRMAAGAEPCAVVPVSFATVRRVCGFFEDGTCSARRGAPCEPAPCPFLALRPPAARRLGEREIDRRTFAAQGAVAAAAAGVAVVAAGAAAGLGRLAGGAAKTTPTSTFGQRGGPTPTTTTSSPGGPTTASAPSGAPMPKGTRIGPAADVPVGGAAAFTDPSSGDPSLIVQPQSGTFLAFDAVCPHAGCTVEWDPSGRLFVCPCHGSEFNGRTGAVEIGPAATGLASIRIAEGPDGQLYVD
jgi:thiosulfate dehydrogenase (quinone) large subunit